MIAGLTLPVTGCRDRTLSDPADLGAVEVREYEGEDLSSINEFRENSIKGPQQLDREAYRLTITGLVDRPLSLTYREVIDTHQEYRKVVRLSCVEGWSVDILWQGILLADLLDRAGADPGARVVIFRSADGYSTSLPADYIRDNDILLAYRMNDVELPPDRGFPFQLVAEEKWGYKWAKWITEIEVSDDTSFRGYWESRGYENDADL
ncbi:MAG: oxidoreductase [Actinobacteria bacterium HGW-Actinobacteria-10]|nr:MAG: oxidoreductase [Actinobacteria bacterium HGW-Actinobacteria-10]